MERNATVLVVVLGAAIFALLRWVVPGTSPIASTLALEPHIPLLLSAAIGTAALALFLAALAKAPGRSADRWLGILLVGGLSVAGLAVANPWLRLALLELAVLLTVFLVWISARSRAAKFTYLAAVLLSTFCAIMSEVTANATDPTWARAFLLTGIFVKLAAIPMFFWLLSLADELPALVLGLIIAVVDMAAFGEFAANASKIGGALQPQGLLVWAAALTSLLAALLMLTQRSLKRILVLSTVEDVGFLLLGVASAQAIGLKGALIAASTHALAKALLFACLATPEAAGELNKPPIALASRYPYSAFGFLFGMLAMLGIPPTMGFIGRWRLYSAALQIGPLPLAIFILSSILALIAYTLALTRNWWGPPSDSQADSPPAASPREPYALKAAIVCLVIVLVGAGVWPAIIEKLMEVRP
jgi:multicomponent Na+:H+ antiporter subunit D